ncbi:hypothetical protein [Pseudomonas syringae]|uniref:hypothetical protein n=1 Tax=Pseudomonas syringae TaxID=317 RepID=UPI00200A307A|nr:hypothetical protein [Pseudomonas syringae]MCK9695864.1 hypothetical protein [Pseudomonas syringae pv. syringae]MCK9728466.1 hypothetical protein [Pseudomonas syringae pv. syringae]
MAILFIFIALNLIRARVENVSPENDRSAKENVGCAKGDLRSRSRFLLAGATKKDCLT